MLDLRRKLYPNFVAWEYHRGKSSDMTKIQHKPKTPWLYKLRLRLCYLLWPQLKTFRSTFINEVKKRHKP